MAGLNDKAGADGLSLPLGPISSAVRTLIYLSQCCSYFAINFENVIAVDAAATPLPAMARRRQSRAKRGRRVAHRCRGQASAPANRRGRQWTVDPLIRPGCLVGYFDEPAWRWGATGGR